MRSGIENGLSIAVLAAVWFTVPACAPAAMNSEAQQQASQLYQKHDWPALEALAKRSASADSKDAMAWYYLGLAEDGLGRKSDGTAAYEKALPNMPAYLQGSVAQLLAQDYAALNQTDKLVALYRQFEKSNPELARALQTQFPAVRAKTTPAATLPDVSPQTLAQILADVRRTWKADAAPVQIGINVGGSPEKIDFYSASAHAGLTVVGNNRLTSQNPNWNTAPIPANFLSLAAAMARMPGSPTAADLDHAYLFRLSADASDPVNLAWEITVKAGTAPTTEVTAYVMPKDEFDRLVNSANGGNAQAEYTLGRVYASGVAGAPDREKSAQWILKAAQQHLPAAANALGQYDEFGIGVTRNVNTAAQWYSQAANAGFAPGQYNLGLMYERGWGVPQNFVNARDWINKAAKQGLPEAQDELPLAIAAANGQIKKYEEMKAQQARSNQCGPGWRSIGNGRCANIGENLNTFMRLNGHPM